MASINSLQRQISKLRREVDRLSSVGTKQRMRGPIDMGRHQIKNIAEGSKGSDAAAVSQLNSVGGATFVTVSASSSLTTERVLTAGAGIALADGGANSTITVSAQAAIDDAMAFAWMF